MKISIITVNLNGGRFLAESLGSVLGQDHRDLELIVIDGGSSDGSLEIISAAAADDRRLSWLSEPDAGIADAMNKGLARATGQVVAFLHADDSYCHREVLALVAAVMAASPGALWLTGGMREVDASGTIMRSFAARRFSRRRLLRNNILFHPATFVRREAFAHVGRFDSALRYAMDYDFWLRLSLISPPLVLEPLLANFRVHAGSLSCANRRATLEEEYRVRRRYLHNSFSRFGHALYHRWRCHCVAAE